MLSAGNAFISEAFHPAADVRSMIFLCISGIFRLIICLGRGIIKL